MSLKKPKIKLGEFIQEAPEAIQSLTNGLADSIKNDVVKGSMNDAWTQFSGNYEKPSQSHPDSGELTEGEELDLESLNKPVEKLSQYIEPGIDYKREILHTEKKIAQENSAEIKSNIEEIKVELKQLINTIELQVEYGKIVVEQTTEKPGKYHENFFVWLLSFIKATRLKVQDSASWLAMFQSKKKQKGYWQMFKKHGTTFGLSNERVVATQTG